jgi:hypothetical protein
MLTSEQELQNAILLDEALRARQRRWGERNAQVRAALFNEIRNPLISFNRWLRERGLRNTYGCGGVYITSIPAQP